MLTTYPDICLQKCHTHQ